MRKLLDHKTLFKYLFWIWLITIFTLSCLPSIPAQQINIWNEPFRLDYLEHFLVFGGLAVLFTIWKSNENGTFNLKRYTFSIFLLFGFASVSEMCQILIPGRSFNPLDLIYNILGLISFLIVSPVIIKQFYKN